MRLEFLSSRRDISSNSEAMLRGDAVGHRSTAWEDLTAFGLLYYFASLFQVRG